MILYLEVWHLELSVMDGEEVDFDFPLLILQLLDENLQQILAGYTRNYKFKT